MQKLAVFILFLVIAGCATKRNSGAYDVYHVYDASGLTPVTVDNSNVMYAEEENYMQQMNDTEEFDKSILITEMPNDETVQVTEQTEVSITY